MKHQILNGISYAIFVIAFLLYLGIWITLASDIWEELPADVAFREKMVFFFQGVSFANFLCGCVVSYFAHRNGRPPIRWFFIGLLLGPIGCFIVWCLPKMKKCPACMKRVDRCSTRCRFCQIDIKV